MSNHKTVETKKSTQAKRVSVSFESQQENVVMSLLAHYGIIFEIIPPRKSCQNCQFIDIKSVVINGAKYDFADYVDHVIEEYGKTLQPSSVHYNKYQKRNQTAATNNVLTEMIQKLGWKVFFKNSKESTITVKMERINVLSCNEVVINGDDIAKFGEELNKELKKVVKAKKEGSLFVGFVELPIHKYIDMKSISKNTDLYELQKMMTPINISKQIGNEEEIQIEKRNIVESSKVLDVSHNQLLSQQVTTTYDVCNGISGGNAFSAAGAFGTATPAAGLLTPTTTMDMTTTTSFGSHGINHDYPWYRVGCAVPEYEGESREERREEEEERKEKKDNKKDKKDDKDDKKMIEEHIDSYYNELPPATNIPQSSISPIHQNIQLQQVQQNSLFSFNSFNGLSSVTSVNGYNGNGNELGWVLVNLGGQLCFCPTVYLQQEHHDTDIVSNDIVYRGESDMNMNGYEDCGFFQSGNHLSTV